MSYLRGAPKEEIGVDEALQGEEVEMTGVPNSGLKIGDGKTLFHIWGGRFIRCANEEFRTVEWKEVKEYGNQKNEQQKLDKKGDKSSPPRLLYAHEQSDVYAQAESVGDAV